MRENNIQSIYIISGIANHQEGLLQTFRPCKGYYEMETNIYINRLANCILQEVYIHKREIPLII